ncbi:MAG: cobyrinate a,c-diamide synthase [Propionicimonas sp.]|uniref:cobyrinate a,c-diamide synthase n=1 Tax=Propionicimonas sp. TaxID=1955623 RepID=UPI003D1461CC
MVRIPRLVVAAAASSAGKTTIATGLMAALRGAGHEVAGFKVGPDFIDPGYHALSTGRPGRNLDPVLTSEALVSDLFLHGVGTPTPADVAIVEGVMGLFDGQLASGGFGSTAHVARLIDAPVLLVVDAAGSSRTAAAAALGLRGFDPTVRIAGVVVNRVASTRHAAELASVFEGAGVPVLGMVPRNAGVSAPSRHLGLVPAAERRESAAMIDALAAHVAAHVDLDGVLGLAATASDLAGEAWRPSSVVTPVAGRPLVGVMAGRAFTFRYAETTELLEAAGCRVVEIDPLRDTALPTGIAGLYVGGGFPEVHAVELSRNAGLRGAIAEAVADGLPTVAECAGQLYLGEHLDGHPMVGALAAGARMTPRLTLGYRSAEAPADTLLAAAGTTVRGHEFHRTRTEPGHGAPAWMWDGRPEGFTGPNLHSSYLHVHWAGHPACAQRFADAAARFATAGTGARPPRPESTVDGIDLHHHGDHDLGPGLVDLAVNVQPGPPGWLAEVIGRSDLARYPDAAAAREAIADSHGVHPTMVLPTAGGAEGFALIARTLTASHPLVVHPQFTEPEAALRAAGHAVQRWLLPVAAGESADPAGPPLGDLPAWADALFVGNPTNPTGWLHRRDHLLDAGRGRLLVIDEAFMDATDESQSLIAPSMRDRLVLRSLSKTWGLPGLRVGYVVGDPALIARLAEAQPSWPVSAPAAAAMVATSAASALAEAAARYREVAADRVHLVAALAAAGFPSVPGTAPFVLVDTTSCGPTSVRPALARAGFAVRRGESFPGLGPTWVRVKVPAPAVADAFVAALAGLRVR